MLGACCAGEPRAVGWRSKACRTQLRHVAGQSVLVAFAPLPDQ